MIDTQKLRQRILDLAIRGKLVPQDPNDEPASVLLEKIRAEKERLIAEGKIKRPKAKKTSDKSHYEDFQPPFEIPESWEWVRLEEICKVITDGDHQAPPKSKNGIPFLVISDVISGRISFHNCRFVPEDYYNNLDGNRRAEYGDILFTVTGSYGKPILVDTFKPFCFQRHIGLIKPLIHNDYLMAVLSSDYILKECNKTATGTAQKTVGLESIRNFLIPIPSQKEQEKICKEIAIYNAIIDEITANKEILTCAISLCKSKILDLAMQGKLVEHDPSDESASDMLRRINPKAKIITDNPHYPQLPDNWVLTNLESVCNYGHCDSVNVEDISSDDWILELEDIEKDSGKILSRQTKQYRSVSGIRHRFGKSDVLYSKLRTYLNKVLLAPEDGYCTAEIIPITAYDCILPEYLCSWLRSPHFMAYTLQCGYGVKMPRLSTSDARNGIVPLPPLNEQKRIIAYIDRLYHQLNEVSAVM